MRRLSWTAVWAATLAASLGGCAQSSRHESAYGVKSGASKPRDEKKYEKKDEGKDSRIADDASASMRYAARSDASAEAPAPVERKIIYNVELDVVVKDFSEIQAKVESATKEFAGAYVAQASLEGNVGTSRSGRWVLRVPQSTYEEFIRRLRSLGDVYSEQKKSDDITDEYYDLESHLKNKRETEARLIKLQQDKPGELKDILEIEEQIDRVRGEIDQMQGRLDRMNTLSRLATVTLSVREIRNYQPAESLTLWDRVSSTFDDSIAGLREFGVGLLLAATALAPWLPLLILAFFAVRFGWRKFVTRRSPTVVAAKTK